MNKYDLEISVQLKNSNGYGGSMLVMDHLNVKGVTFFQMCVILGALQAVIREETAEPDGK